MFVTPQSSLCDVSSAGVVDARRAQRDRRANADLQKQPQDYEKPGIYLRAVVFDEMDPRETRCFRLL
jgi:hypothetical protein